MALSRAHRHNLAAIARYKAAKNKPLERRRVQSFLSPITKGLNQLLTGEVEVSAENDLPVTRLNHADEWEETHKCLNGVIAVLSRLMPDMDVDPLRWVSSDLEHSRLMSEKKVLRAKKVIKEIEDRMLKHTWQQVIDATRDTQIEVHMEQLGLKDAA